MCLQYGITNQVVGDCEHCNVQCPAGATKVGKQSPKRRRLIMRISAVVPGASLQMKLCVIRLHSLGWELVTKCRNWGVIWQTPLPRAESPCKAGLGQERTKPLLHVHDFHTRYLAARIVHTMPLPAVHLALFRS